MSRRRRCFPEAQRLYDFVDAVRAVLRLGPLHEPPPRHCPPRYVAHPERAHAGRVERPVPYGEHVVRLEW